MALQPDIQYVQFYIDGSAAKKLERQPVHKPAVPAPERRRARRKAIAVDPVAIIGIVLVMGMLIAMVAGLFSYFAGRERNRMMSDYVISMELENDRLRQQYRDGYDLEEIQEMAENMGMIPAADAQQIQIQVQIPQEETVEMGFWKSITTFLAGLFT